MMIVSNEEFNKNYSVDFDSESNTFVITHVETNTQYELVHQFEDGSKKLTPLLFRFIEINQSNITHEGLCDICNNHFNCTVAGKAEGCLDRFDSGLSKVIKDSKNIEITWTQADGVNCFVNNKCVFHKSGITYLWQLAISLPHKIAKRLSLVEGVTNATSVSIHLDSGDVTNISFSDMSEVLVIVSKILDRLSKLTTSNGKPLKSLFVPKEYYNKLLENKRQLSPLVQSDNNCLLINQTIIKPSDYIKRKK